MTYQQTDMYPRTGNWLADTARRKPEALLLMAAGCALLLRSGRRPAGSMAQRMAMGDQSRREPNDAGARSASSRAREGLHQAAETVSTYAGNVGDTAKAYASSVADTVTDYADTARLAASEYAQDARQTAARYSEEARRSISETSDRLRTQAETTYQTAAASIREQPILVAALGLAAGAAVAALFPATEIERRTLGATSDALAEKAAETGENLLAAASQAGERLKEAASERGLDREGIRDMARDVAGTFAGAVTGQESTSGAPGRGTRGTDEETGGTGSKANQATANQATGWSSGNVSGRS